jgi:hypothetical protein
LHVLGAPPAFVLSQDQTLHRDGRTGLAAGFARFVGVGLSALASLRSAFIGP